MRISQPGTGKKVSFTLKGESRRRMLIADDDTALSRAIADYFTGRGWECRITYTVTTAKDVIDYWHPDAVMVDLLLPHTNALTLMKHLNAKPMLHRPRVIVMSKQALPKAISAVKKAGADAYLIKPFTFDDALRLVDPAAALPKPEPVAVPPFVPKEEGLPWDMSEKLDPTTKVMLKELHLVNLFLKQALDHRKPSENLFNLMRMVSLKVKAVRCSFIRIVNEETGVVMASNDDRSVAGLPIQLRKYPEIREVMRTLQVLLIPHVKSSELMAPVRELMAHTKFETIAIFPIFIRGRFFGVTSLRMEQRDPIDMFYVDSFGQVTAQILSLTLSGEELRRVG